MRNSEELPARPRKRRKSVAGRSGSLLGGSLWRTIGLGCLAVVAALIWVAREMDLDRDELLAYLGSALLFVGAFTLLGIVAGGLLWGLKRLRRRLG